MKLLCSPCHKSCSDRCSGDANCQPQSVSHLFLIYTGAGPKSCTVCAPGYVMNTEHGCLVRQSERAAKDYIFCSQDTDECIIDNPCPKDKFCVNNDGSYRCVTCDKACDGCDADGPDNCLKCAEGYKLKKNVCVADKAASGRKESLFYYLIVTFYIQVKYLTLTTRVSSRTLGWLWPHASFFIRTWRWRVWWVV